MLYVDGTHHVSNKDIKLLSVMVADDEKTLQPGAWCLHKSESTATFRAFFGALDARLSQSCRDNLTKIMTDDNAAGTLETYLSLGCSRAGSVCVWPFQTDHLIDALCV
jgi:hypothetical protein